MLYGENTDWRGITQSIRRSLPARILKPEAALIIGAGGTSRAAIYALWKLGVPSIYLFNRTESSARVLVDAFPDVNIKLVQELGVWPDKGPAPTIIISTVPASATSLEPSASDAIFLRSSILSAPGGVVIDMAYKPAETPLLALAATHPSLVHDRIMRLARVLSSQVDPPSFLISEYVSAGRCRKLFVSTCFGCRRTRPRRSLSASSELWRRAACRALRRRGA